MSAAVLAPPEMSAAISEALACLMRFPTTLSSALPCRRASFESVKSCGIAPSVSAFVPSASAGMSNFGRLLAPGLAALVSVSQFISLGLMRSQPWAPQPFYPTCTLRIGNFQGRYGTPGYCTTGTGTDRIDTAGGRPARARVTTFRRMGDSMNSFYFLGRVVPRAV